MALFTPSWRLLFFRLCCSLLVCCSLFVTPCVSQQLPSAHYTIRDGLAQMQVTCVLKDSRGYIWAGTKQGLSKFDGEHFENFTKKDGLLTNYIHKLAEDPQGNIWFSNILGMVRFDGRTFTTFPTPNKSTQTHDFWIGSDGRPLVLLNENEQLVRLAKLQNGRYVPVVTLWDKAQQIEGGSLFYDARRERLYFALHQRGVKQNLADSRLLYVHNGRVVLWKKTNQVAHVWSSRPPLSDGTPVLVGLTGDQQKTETRYYIQNDELIPFFRTDHQSAPVVLQPPPASAVIEHAGHHYLLEKGSRELQPLPIPSTQLWGFTFDQNGLWCASDKGLCRVWLNGFRYFPESQVPYCWGVVEDKQGHHWFLNYQSSLQRFNGQTVTTVTGYKETVMGTTSYASDNWYYHPIRDRFGNLWLTNSNGAIRYDGQTFRKVTDSPQSATYCLLEDPARNLILMGGEQQVLFAHNAPPYAVERFDQSNGLHDSGIMAMALDRHGLYWFGGRNLTRYDYDRKKATDYTRENGRFPGAGVMSMALDSRQNVWVGAYRGGLLRYDEAHDRFETVLADSLISSSIMLVGSYDRDHLIFGDAANLYVMDLAHYYRTKQVKCRIFNHHNGFMGLEPGQNGYYRDSRGHIWITSGSVLSRLEPSRISLTSTSTHLFITKINDQRVGFVGKTPVMTLPKDQNMATFTVETVGDDQPFQAEYSYRVAGLVDKWSPWQHQNLITLTNLSGGDYTLEVRSRLGSPFGDPPVQVSQSFRVALPFWKAPDFYWKALVAMLVLLCGLGLLAFGKWIDRRRIRLQQQSITERERQVQFLQIQTLQAQMNPHFTFNVLGTIQHLIATHDTELATQSLLKLANLIRNYLEATMLGNESHGSLFAHEIPLAQEIELLQLYIEFEQLQYAGRFTYTIEVPDSLTPETYRLPPLILQPYVENAIKHGLLYSQQPGQLAIRFKLEEDEVLVCTIEDDGVGRQRARQIQDSSLKKYRSRGTELVKRRVELLNQMGYAITIDTDDRSEGGTLVRIEIGYQSNTNPQTLHAQFN